MDGKLFAVSFFIIIWGLEIKAGNKELHRRSSNFSIKSGNCNQFLARSGNSAQPLGFFFTPALPAPILVTKDKRLRPVMLWPCSPNAWTRTERTLFFEFLVYVQPACCQFIPLNRLKVYSMSWLSEVVVYYSMVVCCISVRRVIHSYIIMYSDCLSVWVSAVLFIPYV